MIHEPDTPFRKFFNAHAADFRSGKVDYAKTTILGDIVSRVNNREFIRLMVQNVIDRHKNTAIASLTQNQTIREFSLEISKLRKSFEDLKEVKGKSEAQDQTLRSSAYRNLKSYSSSLRSNLKYLESNFKGLPLKLSSIQQQTRDGDEKA